MHYIQLTLKSYDKVMVNLDKVDTIMPNQMNNFRNAKSTVISFGGDDNFIEVLEPMEEIEKMINLVQNFGGVNYHD